MSVGGAERGTHPAPAQSYLFTLMALLVNGERPQLLDPGSWDEVSRWGSKPLVDRLTLWTGRQAGLGGEPVKKQLVSEQTISGTQAMNSASYTSPLMSLSLIFTLYLS